MKIISRNKLFTLTNIALTAAVIIIILLFIRASFFLPDTVSYLKCEGNVTMSVSYEDVNAATDASVQFILKDRDAGMLRITGTLLKDGKTLDVNRSYSIGLKNIDATNYEVVVKKESVHQTDGIQQDFFYHDFFPEKIGEPFIVSVRRVNSNAVMVDGLAYPYFICVLSK